MPQSDRIHRDAATPVPTAFERAALVVLQVGAIAVVIAAVVYKQFELDRFFIPKELVLHVVATIAALCCLARTRELRLSRVDQLLMAYLAIGLVSALFAANWWAAGRAVSLSLSGATCFWCSRVVARAGLARGLVAALVLAGVVGAITALLQTYGLRIDAFSLNRAPGGTFGNRNFMAHVCVIVFPALLLSTLRAESPRAFGWWAAALAAVAGALVLSRSRAAWLALLVCVVVLLAFAYFAARRARGMVRWRRLPLLLVIAGAGGGLALVMPNTLNWKSDSPYLETARSVVNYREGSGRGRLEQYKNSARMSLRHPLLGVGPGNWAVVYPRFASPGDPSLSSDGMTANPWPSSDWMAFLSERGPVAFVLLALAMIALLVDAMRALRTESDPEHALASWALLGTVSVLLVVSTFDAVLLLPAPALIAWGLLGALSPPSRTRTVVALSTSSRVAAMLLVTILGGLSIARNSTQLGAMAVYESSTRASRVERAAELDPGSYRIHLRLAETYAKRGSCANVRLHAGAARELFPNAAAPKRLLARCSR
ncbi:MAG TPA: O-antigen ligase family protein [Gemmatimonadaceae bacterium]|nr:O-antigen ligase family protein [Gemmatimonadaceae bacterium]